MSLVFVTFPKQLIVSRSTFPRTVQEKARAMVSVAVHRKALQKQPCCVCGDEKASAHHDDYNQPNVVTFLCRKHHTQRHQELGWGIPHRGSQPGIPKRSKFMAANHDTPTPRKKKGAAK